MLEDSTPPEPAPVDEPAAPAKPVIAELSPPACAQRLAELFPALFTPGSAKPLKLRIQADIQQRAPGIFTKRTLSTFLHRHTTSTAYLKALVNSPQRIDLDGAPAGETAEEHRAAAVAELERRRAMHDARRAAEREAQRAAYQAAQEQERRTRHAQDQVRRDCEALVRAFESSTLTRSNFLALKGISEAELAAALAMPRAAPAAPMPATGQPPRHDAQRPGRREPDDRAERPQRGERGQRQRPPAVGKPAR